MLNNNDIWPISCVNCNEPMGMAIGELRKLSEIKCRRCASSYRIRRENFDNMIDNLRSHVRTIAMNNPGILEPISPKERFSFNR